LPAADVVQFLNTIYDTVADAEFLVRVLAKNGLHEVCLYYDKKAGGRILSDWERMFFAKAYPTAAREEAGCMARCCAMRTLAERKMEGKTDDFLPERLRCSDSEGLQQEMQEYLIKLERVFPWGPEDEA
jgi:hypothetical protein